jgi:hypothetical protein
MVYFISLPVNCLLLAYQVLDPWHPGEPQVLVAAL